MRRFIVNASIALALGLGLTLAMLWVLVALGPGIPLPGLQTARAAAGEVYCVTPGGGTYAECDQVFTNVQAAVDAATGGEEIRVATGTYTDVQARAGVTQVVYISKTVTIRGGYSSAFTDPPDPLANPTELDAQGLGRVLYITGDISPTIEGLRITGGDARGLGGGLAAGDFGGGVYVITAMVTMNNNQVFSNTAREGGGGRGGGMFFYNSPEVTLSDNIVSGNNATLAGGLYFYNSPTATLTTNIISNNVANHLGGGMKHHGGVLFLFSDDATLIGNTISGNWAANLCGGVCFSSSDNAMLVGNTIISNGAGSSGFVVSEGGGLRIVGSANANLISNTISGNRTNTFGGGLYVGSNSTITLTANTIRSNEATQGGGLYLSASDAVLSGNIVTTNTVRDYSAYDLDGDGGGIFLSNTAATLTNNVVADNQAETVGSGIYIQDSSPHLLHTSIAGNRGGDGSGVHITGTNSAIAFTNTILVSHTVGITVAAGNTATLNGVLWYGNTRNIGGMGTITVTHEYTGDPAFAADGYHLTFSSEAIDKGVNAGVTTDIDGDQRPCGSAPDLGADEISCLYLPIMLKNSS